MYAGKAELCGVDTSQLPVLSESEKSALLRAARAGDASARQKMIQGNLRLVLSVVQKFSNRGENLDVFPVIPKCLFTRQVTVSSDSDP